MEYSRNERAEQLLGLRPPGVAVLAPSELGYRCPICKNAPMVEHEYDERLTWSEYNSFLWCSVCDRDFPSCLCLEDTGRAIDVFLASVAEAVQYSYRKSLSPPPKLAQAIASRAGELGSLGEKDEMMTRQEAERIIAQHFINRGCHPPDMSGETDENLVKWAGNIRLTYNSEAEGAIIHKTFRGLHLPNNSLGPPSKGAAA